MLLELNRLRVRAINLKDGAACKQTTAKACRKSGGLILRIRFRKPVRRAMRRQSEERVWREALGHSIV